MRKSIHRDENEVVLKLLRELRVTAGLTQSQVSSELGRSQSFMSDVESGSRRLDLIQLRDLCVVLGSDLQTFVTEFESALVGKKRRGRTS
jgi:transcriptional regulator with XRE-family HTH domain